MYKLGYDTVNVWYSSNAEPLLNQLAKRTPFFVLTVAYTATVQLNGLSGAGATAELRELTAIADAEIIAYGEARCLAGVPSNPMGVPGPTIITKAAFKIIPCMEYFCVDAGLKISANIPNLIKLKNAKSALAVTTGEALEVKSVQALFEEGLELGKKLGQVHAKEGYLILAESVPGGTTTALGLLTALGIEASVSSSMPGNSQSLKKTAIESGLAKIGASKGSFAAQPAQAVAAVGDAMQPVVAGMALAASQFCPVILGGGTQMAAVLALMAAWQQADGLTIGNLARIGLVTTGWVAFDPHANLTSIAQAIQERFAGFTVPYFAAKLDFSQSRYEALRLYEQGYVKEGVGAGAAAFAAMLAGNLSANELLPTIEETYIELCKKQAAH